MYSKSLTEQCFSIVGQFEHSKDQELSEIDKAIIDIFKNPSFTNHFEIISIENYSNFRAKNKFLDFSVFGKTSKPNTINFLFYSKKMKGFIRNVNQILSVFEKNFFKMYDTDKQKISNSKVVKALSPDLFFKSLLIKDNCGVANVCEFFNTEDNFPLIISFDIFEFAEVVKSMPRQVLRNDFVSLSPETLESIKCIYSFLNLYDEIIKQVSKDMKFYLDKFLKYDEQLSSKHKQNLDNFIDFFNNKIFEFGNNEPNLYKSDRFIKEIFTNKGLDIVLIPFGNFSKESLEKLSTKSKEDIEAEILLRNILSCRNENFQSLMNAQTEREKILVNVIEQLRKIHSKDGFVIKNRNEEISNMKKEVDRLTEETNNMKKTVKEINDLKAEVNVLKQFKDIERKKSDFIFETVEEAEEVIPDFLKISRLSTSSGSTFKNNRFVIAMNDECSMVWDRIDRCFTSSIHQAEIFASFSQAIKQAFFIRKYGIYTGDIYIREVSIRVTYLAEYSFKLPKNSSITDIFSEITNSFKNNHTDYLKKKIDKTTKEVKEFENFYGKDDLGLTW